MNITELKQSYQNTPFVFLETALIDKENQSSLLFTYFSDILTFHYQDYPQLFFKKVEDYLAKGYWISGYFNYEFGYFLEPALKDLREENNLPLAWLGVSRAPRIINRTDLKSNLNGESHPVSYTVKKICSNITEKEYAGALGRIKEYLEEGFSYQVNHTFKMKFDFQGDLFDFYFNLRRAQPTSYLAFINTGNNQVLSFNNNMLLIKSRHIYL